MRIFKLPSIVLINGHRMICLSPLMTVWVVSRILICFTKIFKSVYVQKRRLFLLLMISLCCGLVVQMIFQCIKIQIKWKNGPSLQEMLISKALSDHLSTMEWKLCKTKLLKLKMGYWLQLMQLKFLKACNGPISHLIHRSKLSSRS